MLSAGVFWSGRKVLPWEHFKVQNFNCFIEFLLDFWRSGNAGEPLVTWRRFVLSSGGCGQTILKGMSHKCWACRDHPLKMMRLAAYSWCESPGLDDSQFIHGNEKQGWGTCCRSLPVTCLGMASWLLQSPTELCEGKREQDFHWMQTISDLGPSLSIGCVQRRLPQKSIVQKLVKLMKYNWPWSSFMLVWVTHSPGHPVSQKWGQLSRNESQPCVCCQKKMKKNVGKAVYQWPQLNFSLYNGISHSDAFFFFFWWWWWGGSPKISSLSLLENVTLVLF